MAKTASITELASLVNEAVEPKVNAVPSFEIGADFEPMPASVRTRESIYPWDKVSAPREVNGQIAYAYFDVFNMTKAKFDTNVNQKNNANKKKGNEARYRCVNRDFAGGVKGVRVYRVS